VSLDAQATVMSKHNTAFLTRTRSTSLCEMSNPKTSMENTKKGKVDCVVFVDVLIVFAAATASVKRLL
jgi:hypothetical protein